MGKCSLSFPSPSLHPPTLFSGYHVSCANQYFIAVAPEQWSPPPVLPPSLQLSEWQIRVRMGVGGAKWKAGRGAGGCEAVSGREGMKSREMARVKEGEAWSGWIWRWINGPRVEEEKNAPQIMKLCSENVSQFPCFQRTNYRTKRENVSFMTSKLGRCRLIFPLFVSCCVCFFFLFT